MIDESESAVYSNNSAFFKMFCFAATIPVCIVCQQKCKVTQLNDKVSCFSKKGVLFVINF